MDDQIGRAAQMAGEWWAERLNDQHAHRRDAFAQEVAVRVETALRANPDFPVFTECDYDPRGLLLEAVHAVGIECRGSFFSARGILPEKHDLTIHPDRLEPKEGYGNWLDPIPVSE